MLANIILLHVYSRTAAPRCASTSKNLLAYLLSWHDSIFDCKLTTKAENL